MKRLPVLMAYPPHQSVQAAKVYNHARNLSPDADIRCVVLRREGDIQFFAENTEFFRKHPNAPFPSLQAFGFTSGIEIAGLTETPFIWIEPDSVPLVKRWDHILSEEYFSLGRRFLLSGDSHPPFDLVGGIGVYPEGTNRIVPRLYPTGGWDRWLLDNMPNEVGLTSLIQHNYGHFSESGQPSAWTPDEVRSLLRKDAVVFHRDKHLGLVDHSLGLSFYHTGKIGDIISFLPVIRGLGGGSLSVGSDPDECGAAMDGAPYEALKPLLEAQPYIRSVEFSGSLGNGQIPLDNWREVHSPMNVLTKSQAAYIGLDFESVPMSPWINAPANRKSNHGKDLIFARSKRVRNPRFPWGYISRRYRKRAGFIGLDDEYVDFVANFGPVDRIHVDNLLDAAVAIREARVVVANSTSLWWIARGMGVPVLQESIPSIRDAVLRGCNSEYYLQQSPEVAMRFLYAAVGK